MYTIVSLLLAPLTRNRFISNGLNSEWDFSLFFYGGNGVFFVEKVKNTIDGIDA